MKTYLIFFGKSQDFNFHSFDEDGYIENFNLVIKDFDLLESKFFTVDEIDNLQILSKYNFKTSSGKSFSLLKLYGLAQAFNGNRIEGSIYGVALLSEMDLIISKNNNDLLKVLKEKFSELCLTGIKFKKSNFKDESYIIWETFNKNKYFKAITLGDFPFISPNNSPFGFFVENLFIDSIELNNEIQNSSRLYFSEDLEHLKRNAKKWQGTFTLFKKGKSGYTEFKEQRNVAPDFPAIISETYGLNKLELENSELKFKKEKPSSSLNKNSRVLKKKVRALSILTILFFISTLAFFFRSIRSHIPEQPQSSNVASQQTTIPQSNNTEQRSTTQDHENIIVGIMDSPDSLDILLALCNNIKQFKRSPSSKYYEAIKRDGNKLGIDISFIDSIPQNATPQEEITTLADHNSKDKSDSKAKDKQKASLGGKNKKGLKVDSLKSEKQKARIRPTDNTDSIHN
jgi:hypothetical protein